MNTDNNLSSYELFLSENRKKINERMHVVLLACVIAGPMIAIAIRFGIFQGVSYLTALFVSLFMLTLAVVHRFLLKHRADSILTSMIALFAIDILLIVMNASHLTIYVSWFLIPLLCIQFCDIKLYFTAVAVNYCCMVFATWNTAAYFAERRVDVASPFAYFASRIGGLSIEMVMMVLAGYSLCKMTSHYYKSLIEQSNELDEEHLTMERLNGQLNSVADIYMYLCEINIPDNTFYQFQTDRGRIDELFGEIMPDARESLEKEISEFVDKDYIDLVNRFVDFTTIDKRLGDRKTATVEFLGSNGLWRRGRFIVSGRDNDGRIIRVMYLVEDIDRERKQRQELIDMSERAIAASEAKSSFLSNMSHEIRTPINTVLGMNEMILRESSEKDIVAYSESIRNAGNSLLGIVNDILDFSKIEAGKMEIVPVDYDISSVINDLVNMVHLRADDKGLAINVDFDSRMPKLLHGDEVRIKQIITNILSNAVKYTEKGSILFSIGFERIAEATDMVILKVSVKDTGIGIKTEDMKHLFSEFERIEQERNRNIEGTGLGMTITRSLLEMMGSSLKVESEYGKGSRFFFDLRQRVLDWEPLGDYESSYRLIEKREHKYREKFTAFDAQVLVVDDNAMNLVVFKSLLKQTGIKIDTASGADEGLKLSDDKKYDIIFLDHMMPEKDGIEALHELKGRTRNPNVDTVTVCLTANAISGAREQYIAEGFDDYLTKPIDSTKLEDMLIHYLPKEKVVLTSKDSVFEKGNLNWNILNAQTLIDAKTGVKNSGSESGYESLLRIFYDSLEDKLSEIDGFYQSDDIENYTIKVHALKSSARIIGATALGEEAQKLEDAGKASDIDYILENHEKFMDNCRKHGQLLNPLFEDEKAEDVFRPMADETIVQDFYQRFRKAAEAMDCDRLEKVVNEVKEYDYEPKDKELISKLREASDRFDYDAVLSLLS